MFDGSPGNIRRLRAVARMSFGMRIEGRAALTVLLGLLATIPLHAQEESNTSSQAGTPSALSGDPSDKTLQEVVVTGTRISDPNIAGINPVTTVSAKELEELAPVSVADALQRIPDVRIQGSSGGSTAGSQGDQGFVDLHHLFYNRTLVLINGLRATPTMITSGHDVIGVNIDSIPLAMIDHIEVLKDGASPVYGADAIGGVVNVITRTSYDGLGGSAQIGSSMYGDHTSGHMSLIGGKVFDRADFMVGIDYDQEGLARYDERPQYQPVVDRIGTLAGGQIGPTLPGRTLCPDGIATLPNGDMYTFYAPGQYRAYAPADNCQTDPHTAIAPEIRSFSVMPVAHVQVTDNLTGYFEGLYTYQKTYYSALTLPYSLGAPIPADNPYNPFGVPVSLDRTIYPDAAYPSIDTRQETYRGVLGLKGNFLDGRIQTNIDYVWGRTRDIADFTDNWNMDKLQTALDPTLCAAAAGCVVPDFFGPGTLTPQAASYFLINDWNRNGYDQRIVDGSVQAKLFELPAGTVTGAAGVQYRKDSGFTSVDPYQLSGVSSEGQAADTSGSYDTGEAYAELGLPVLRDQPGAKILALDLATRFSHYSDFGDTTNWKAGLNWAPTEDVRLRASRGTGFRAPNIAELYGGATTNLQGAPTQLDPCVGPVPSLYAAGCSAAGVPAGYQPPAGQGTAVVSAGNPNVKPERSQDLDIGVVITPRWIPRLALSIDYYRVNLTNAIAAPDPVYILDQCYASGGSLSSPYCRLISRNANGTIAAIQDIYTNTGFVKTDGFDLSGHYNFPVAALGLRDPGRVGLDLQGTAVRNYLVQTESGGSVTQYTGILNTGIEGPDSGSIPRFQGSLTTTYSRLDWQVGWAVRWVGRMSIAPSVAARAGVANDPYASAPSIFYHDVFVTKSVRNVNLTVGVQNLFNREAPFTFPGPSYAFGLYDPIGRYYYAKVSVGR
jgi:iron complex outermembrane recepter protein